MSKVIFLVGGPGSGKDILLKTVLTKYNLQELKLEQSIPILTEEKTSSLNKNIIISTKANDYPTIIQNKLLWEHNNYQTAMIFVNVDPSIAKERLQSRLLSEESIQSKLSESISNIPKFKNTFTEFFHFNNNCPIEENPQLKDVEFFCNIFFDQLPLFESKSIKDKLLKKFSPKNKVTTSVEVDNVSPSYTAKDPTGYLPNFSAGIQEGIEYVPDLPAIANDVRSIPQPQFYSPQQQKPRQSRYITFDNTIKAIKKIARRKKHARRKFTT